MGFRLLAGLHDTAGPVAVGLTVIGSVITFAGLLVRQVLVAQKQTSDQSSGWREMLAAADARADGAEVRANAAQQLAAAADHRAIAAEQRAIAAEGRSDLLDLQLDEVRRQIAELRGDGRS